MFAKERGKKKKRETQKIFGSGGIRTHAPEETGALNQRLRPLGHATIICVGVITTNFIFVVDNQFRDF